MNEARVRRAGLDDVDGAVVLFNELDRLESDWRVFAPRPDVLSEIRRRYERLAAATDGILVVAESDGRLIGLGVGEVSKPSSWSDERALYVSNVYVDPAYRRLGIGHSIVAELVAFAAERAMERLVLRVFAPNRDAIAFWTDLGFEPRLTQFTVRIDQLREKIRSRASEEAP
jgi:ribosomal protein S18 acetylase RimI-like enzyme